MADLSRFVARAKLPLERARASYAPVDVVVRVFKRFSEDDGGSYTAALTYYLFFSIFPLLIFGAAILGYVTFGNEELRDEIFEKGVQTVPLIEEALTREGLEAIERARDKLALTGAVLALYSGSGAVVALENALNRLHRIVHERNLLQKRARSLVWLLVLGAGAVVSMGVGTVVSFAGDIFGRESPLVALLGYAGGALLSTLLFAAAFKFLPAKTSSWREVLPGAIVAAIGFELLKIAGNEFIASGQTARNATFGTFAAAAVLLLASSLLARITLMAAEVNIVLQERRLTRQSSLQS